MQRSTSSSYIIAPMRPIRPPTRAGSQVNIPDLEQDMLGDFEKGEKVQWKIKAEQAVHLIPLVLFLCLLVLYICSTIPINDLAPIEAGTQNQEKIAANLQLDHKFPKSNEVPRVTQLHTTASRRVLYEKSKTEKTDVIKDDQSMPRHKESIKLQEA